MKFLLRKVCKSRRWPYGEHSVAIVDFTKFELTNTRDTLSAYRKT